MCAAIVTKKRCSWVSVDDPLLLRGKADLVRGQTDLVPLGLDGPVDPQRRQEKCEDPLVGAAGAAPELLA